METNTVVLSLSDYNQLREFKEKMVEGYTYKLPQPFYHPSLQWVNGVYSTLPEVTYITTDLAMKELLERNIELSRINEELHIKCNELDNDRVDVKILKGELKKMSIWEFIKWRKSR